MCRRDRSRSLPHAALVPVLEAIANNPRGHDGVAVWIEDPTVVTSETAQGTDGVANFFILAGMPETAQYTEITGFNPEEDWIVLADAPLGWIGRNTRDDPEGDFLFYQDLLHLPSPTSTIRVIGSDITTDDLLYG
jgi:hypothetical protein